MNDTYRDIVNVLCLSTAFFDGPDQLRINFPPNWVFIEKTHVMRPPYISQNNTHSQNEIEYIHYSGNWRLLQILRQRLLQTDTTRVLLFILIFIDIQWRLQDVRRRNFILLHF